MVRDTAPLQRCPQVEDPNVSRGSREIGKIRGIGVYIQRVFYRC